jgi:positive regulator of sigma E activity
VEATISEVLQPAVGDSVDIELAATNVLRAASLTYGLPLASMLGLVVVGWMISGTLADSVATMLAAIGLLLGCTISARRLRQGACLQQFVPRIVGIDHSPAESKKRSEKS